MSSSDSSKQNLSAAYELLKQWMDIGEADSFEKLGPAAVYKTSVVLWLMLFQRLNPGASLRDSVLHFVETAPEELKTNKRLRDGSLSTGTGSFSDAKHRLTLKTALWFQDRVASSIINSTPPSWGDQRVFLIDGTTFSLSPTPNLQKKYPPASNQHGEGVWPIANIAFAHELSSGASLPPEIGAMYGPDAVSETKLARSLIERLPARSVVMADAGFGIFSTAFHAKQNGHNFVMRMQKVRFNRIRKEAVLIGTTENSKSYQVDWTPSQKERANNPDLPESCCIPCRIHEIEIGYKNTIYICEDIKASVGQLLDLYWQRYDIEIDIRNIKVVIGTEEIRAKTVEMFLKEFALSMVAYNLTTQLRRESAKIANCVPRELSFTGIWSVYRHSLQGIEVRDPSEWQSRLERALKLGAKQKLPKRPGRSYPREAYGKRPKTTHVKKRKKRKTSEDSNPDKTK